MDFEWDPGKAEGNLRRQGIDFADAVVVFDDPLALSRADDHPNDERCVGVGTDALGRLLVVVYTWRGSRIRIISARRATPSERKAYEATAR